MIELAILATLVVIAWGVAPEMVEGIGMALVVGVTILALVLIIGSGGLVEVLRYFGVAALFVGGLGAYLWACDREAAAAIEREQAERETAERARRVVQSRAERCAENEWRGGRGLR